MVIHLTCGAEAQQEDGHFLDINIKICSETSYVILQFVGLGKIDEALRVVMQIAYTLGSNPHMLLS